MLIYLVYVLVGIASVAMCYIGYLQSTTQFYLCVFSAAIIMYCVYLDYKKRKEKKEREAAANGQNPDGSKKTVYTTSKKKNATTGISQAAHKKSSKL